jgi:hypothetical protein
MRIVAVEEHFTFPDILDRIDSDTFTKNGWPVPGTPVFQAINPPALAETGDGRIAAMDIGRHRYAGAFRSRTGRRDRLRSGRHRNRPRIQRPNGATDLGPARTLCGVCPSSDENSIGCGRRAGALRAECGLKGALISGTIDGKFLDAPEFEPVLACAERLDVPLYIHPGVPPEGVRAAYYDGLPGAASFMLAIAGWGWHAETAVHILRLALSGALDRHPRLKLLIGHMGEGLPTMMERVERVFGGYSKSHLQRNAARAIVDQVWVSTSGFSSMPAFLSALMTFGADRLLFSVDYPFGNNGAAVNFPQQLAGIPGGSREDCSQKCRCIALPYRPCGTRRLFISCRILLRPVSNTSLTWVSSIACYTGNWAISIR